LLLFSVAREGGDARMVFAGPICVQWLYAAGVAIHASGQTSPIRGLNRRRLTFARARDGDLSGRIRSCSSRESAHGQGWPLSPPGGRGVACCGVAWRAVFVCLSALRKCSSWRLCASHPAACDMHKYRESILSSAVTHTHRQAGLPPTCLCTPPACKCLRVLQIARVCLHRRCASSC
jgi:hypothetical protein